MAGTSLHVVFGPSPAGTLRQALSGLGRREKVLDLMDNFSLGPIATDDPDVRGKWLDKELGGHSWEEDERIWRDVARSAADLPGKTIREPKRLVAWYAPNIAESYAGFKWWISHIAQTPVAIMRVPDLHFLGIDDATKLVGREIDLSDEERVRHRAEWQELRYENALLRIVENDSMRSASLDYFDDFIFGFVSTEWSKTTRVIGDSISTINIKTGHYIGDLFTFSRLRALAKLGTIEWEGHSRDMRGSKVRLAGGGLQP